MAGNATMLEYANAQASSRLGALAFEVHRASQTPDADAIHDLRVNIRRFAQSLLVFRSLLPQKEARKVRKRLRRMMDLAGAIRA